MSAKDVKPCSNRSLAIAAYFVPTALPHARQKRAARAVVEVYMTKRTYIKIGVAAALILGFVGVAALQFRGGAEFSSDIGEVKMQFNRDKGKVRLLVLLSPT